MRDKNFGSFGGVVLRATKIGDNKKVRGAVLTPDETRAMPMRNRVALYNSNKVDFYPDPKAQAKAKAAAEKAKAEKAKADKAKADKAKADKAKAEKAKAEKAKADKAKDKPKAKAKPKAKTKTGNEDILS